MSARVFAWPPRHPAKGGRPAAWPAGIATAPIPDAESVATVTYRLLGQAQQTRHFVVPQGERAEIEQQLRSIRATELVALSFTPAQRLDSLTPAERAARYPEQWAKLADWRRMQATRLHSSLGHLQDLQRDGTAAQAPRTARTPAAQPLPPASPGAAHAASEVLADEDEAEDPHRASEALFYWCGAGLLLLGAIVMILWPQA